MPMGDPGGNFAGTGGYGGNFPGYGGASNQSGSGGYGGTGGWGGQFGGGGWSSGITGAGGFNNNGMGNGSMYGAPGSPSYGTGQVGGTGYGQRNPNPNQALPGVMGVPKPRPMPVIQQPLPPLPATAPPPTQQPPPPGQPPWGGVDVNNPYRDRVWGAQAAAWPGGTSGGNYTGYGPTGGPGGNGFNNPSGMLGGVL